MDGVKCALGSRDMTVEASRQCAEDWKEYYAQEMTEYKRPFLLCSGVFSDRPLALWWLISLRLVE